jgi:hypothetical protein
MSFYDQVKKLKQSFGGKRDVEDQDTDTNELLEAGVSIQRGDSRLKGGINLNNMTPSERARIQKYRSGK